MTIISEPVVAAVPADHELAARDRVSLADLARYPVICLPVGTGIRTAFDRACAEAEARPDIALQASAPAAVAALAVRGLGVAILSRSMTTATEHLKPLALTDATVPAVLALVWRKGSSAALSRLLDHLQPAFANEST